MSYFNLNLTGVKGWSAFTASMNNIVNGYLGIGYLVVIFVIAFGVAKYYDNRRATLSAMFLCLVSAVLMRIMKWVTDTTMFGAFACFILTFMWLFLSEQP